eukprot:NODE_378_length_2839_cov_10.673049_g323_i0.p1 GENE.NODE_378_length_2839_cov_10.673049_g323_i0~~NODE_378_length_2839_cov_10.673049_g323_i0.p1  ORF type:complete len:381 (-),score=54.42 NODE_378_length_2839_cov_10.673049_g323_i0:929-2071(-)
MPVVDPLTNKLLAVISLHPYLNYIDQLLAEVARTISTNTLVYVVDLTNGALISSSISGLSINGIKNVDSVTGEAKLIAAVDVDHPIIQYTSRIIEKEGWTNSMDIRIEKDLTINGDSYLVLFQYITDSYGLKWGVVTAIPKKDMFGGLQTIRQRFLYVIVIDQIINLMFSSIVFYIMTRTLEKLSTQMGEVVEEKFNPIYLRKISSELVISCLSEIRPLQDKFIYMLNKLADSTEELVEARRLSEDASRMVAIFMSRASHEMRTPLNGITPILEMCISNNEKIMNENEIELLRSALYCSRMLTYLVDDVLDFSTLKGNKMQFKYREFDLQTCLNNVVAMIYKYSAGMEVEFEIFVDKGIYNNVIGDELRVSQVLVNLQTQ